MNRTRRASGMPRCVRGRLGEGGSLRAKYLRPSSFLRWAHPRIAQRISLGNAPRLWGYLGGNLDLPSKAYGLFYYL